MKQAILMRTWLNYESRERRLYRLTTPYTKTKELLSVGKPYVDSNWLAVTQFFGIERVWHPYFSTESGAMLDWATMEGFDTPREALAYLGYQEVVPAEL